MISLRLVVDTNIVVSAALKPEGLQRFVLLAATTKPASLFVSEEILREYEVVLRRPELRLRKGLRFQLLQYIKNNSRKVHPTKQVRAAIDANDDKFLECAEAARADYLVTGNLRHFPRYWKHTKVVSSRELADIIAPHQTF
ncbi:MAG TPA: putative toxin-antitoxin system toxin component, PIN family [Candidatus Acidoferrum sp.]|nr:putative toxin-antitoxin system toxin component, PIN family [Candidatus Acidoferrum sp.]